MQIKRTLFVAALLLIVPVLVFSGGRNTKVRDANSGDNVKAGLLGSGLFFYDENENNFDRVRGSVAKGLETHVKTMASSGFHTIFYIPTLGTSAGGKIVDLGQPYPNHSWQFFGYELQGLTNCIVDLSGSIDGDTFWIIDRATFNNITVDPANTGGFLRHINDKVVRYVGVDITSCTNSGVSPEDVDVRTLHGF